MINDNVSSRIIQSVISEELADVVNPKIYHIFFVQRNYRKTLESSFNISGNIRYFSEWKRFFHIDDPLLLLRFPQSCFIGIYVLAVCVLGLV